MTVTLPAGEPEPADTRTCACPRCGEDLYFVDGVRGPDRWRHVRTHISRCSPVCAECGYEGTVRIGNDAVGGDGFPAFRIKFWLCAGCAKGRLLVERT